MESKVYRHTTYIMSYYSCSIYFKLIFDVTLLDDKYIFKHYDIDKIICAMGTSQQKKKHLLTHYQVRG